MGVGASLADTRFRNGLWPGNGQRQPERVVTLYEGALDTTLAVDANPVGAVITRGGSDVADYIKSRAGDIASGRSGRKILKRLSPSGPI